jgi:hypothetical protein
MSGENVPRAPAELDRSAGLHTRVADAILKAAADAVIVSDRAALA